MIRHMRAVAAAVAFVGVTGLLAPATADIFVYRDRYGVSHYTNSLDNVPAEYRGNAMTVARDWERAAPPPEPEPAPEPEKASAPQPEAPPEPSSSARDVGSGAEPEAGVFEAGFEAGMRAVGTASVTAIATSTVVPIVQIVAPEPPRHVHGLVPFPGRVPRRPPAEPDDEPAAFPGPAGPPPLGAAGPPPFSASGR